LGEIGQLDSPLGAAIMATGAFPVDQKRQSFLKGQFGIFWVGKLLLQAVTEGRQAQLNEFVEQRLDKH
jgi:hypothetical protein